MAVRPAATKKIDALISSPRSDRLALARALSDLKKRDPQAFRELLEEHPRRKRMVYDLVATWRRFETSNVDPTMLARVGWAKLSIIARHSKSGVDEALVDTALHNTAKGLIEIVRGGPDPQPDTRSVLLRLSSEQYRSVSKALVACGAKPAKNGKGLSGMEAAITEMSALVLGLQGQ